MTSQDLPPTSDPQAPPPSDSKETPKPDPFANSPLGKDDSTPPPADPPAKAKPPEAPAPTGVNITPEQLALLEEKAANFDTISEDDKAMSMLRAHYAGETLGTPDPNAPPPDNSDHGKQIEAMRSEMAAGGKALQAIQEQLATIVLSDFAGANPDFEKHRQVVGDLIGRYPGMTLDRALVLARAEGTQEPSPNGELKPAPVQAVVETNAAGEVPGASDDLGDVESRIANTKEVPSFDQAVKMAVDAAKAHHGVR